MLCLLTMALAPALLAPAPGHATEPPRIDDEAQATYKQVTWDDFKGRWRRQPRFGAEAAYIASGIQISDWSTDPQRQPDATWVARPDGLTAFSFMEKFESSVEPGQQSDYALAHEQGHFDLTEVVARELRVELLDLEGTGAIRGDAAVDLQSRVDEAFAAALARMDRIQQQYDGETVHGTKKKKQRQWLADIRERLAAAQHKLDQAQAARSR